MEILIWIFNAAVGRHRGIGSGESCVTRAGWWKLLFRLRWFEMDKGPLNVGSAFALLYPFEGWGGFQADMWGTEIEFDIEKLGVFRFETREV